MASLNIASSIRVFPTKPHEPRTVPLSILDAHVGDFAPAAAAWVYEASPQTDRAFAADRLRESLARTLDVYPQLSGQLDFTTYVRGGDHTTRSRRMQVSYGGGPDPGVEFVVADSESDLQSILPANGPTSAEMLDSSTFSQLPLLPKSPALASHTTAEFQGLPCLIIQLTRFRCGGVILTLKASHPLADAQTLCTFARDWAAINRAVLEEKPVPAFSRPFCPGELDSRAVADIDALHPNPSVLEISHQLPVHWYDWWAPSSGGPGWAASSARIPDHLTSLPPDMTFENPMPWKDWDMTLSIQNVILQFSREEVDKIWAAAASDLDAASPRISRLDALQAHLWRILIRAYEPTSDEVFHMHLTLGLRDRLQPALGSDFLGSPIVLARASASSSDSLPSLARSIRRTVAQFTPARAAALLHDMACSIDSRRFWGGFIGRRNLIITSWVRLGVYEIDFGSGRPRFVHALMPFMEGVVQIMESPQTTGVEGPWYADGVNISLMLPTDIVAKLVALRTFEE
ncbi:unnamed protein product [Mycena citricolor]|uniref:Transferase family protein n=1 Tax=Mycena citricolor TaxID=2018698 RepID=A0AAD2JYH9_9AGAR|nr:unnamed protein product [Mycena citricolor]